MIVEAPAGSVRIDKTRARRIEAVLGKSPFSR
jgi:hypothetical protein